MDDETEDNDDDIRLALHMTYIQGCIMVAVLKKIHGWPDEKALNFCAMVSRFVDYGNVENKTHEIDAFEWAEQEVERWLTEGD